MNEERLILTNNSKAEISRFTFYHISSCNSKMRIRNQLTGSFRSQLIVQLYNQRTKSLNRRVIVYICSQFAGQLLQSCCELGLSQSTPPKSWPLGPQHSQSTSITRQGQPNPVTKSMPLSKIVFPVMAMPLSGSFFLGLSWVLP